MEIFKISPTHIKSTSIFVAGAIVTASLGWVTTNYLDKPNISVSILSVNTGDQKTEFTLFYVGMVEEFLGEIPGVRKELLSAASGLERRGVDFSNPNVTDRETTASILEGVLESRERLMKKIPLSLEKVEAGLNKATQALQRLRQAQVDVANFINQHPTPTEKDLSEYIKIFEKYDDDIFYTKYTPRKPNSRSDYKKWHSIVVKTSEALNRAIVVIDTGIQKISEEIEVSKKATTAKLLDVSVIVKNAGNTPTGIYQNAAIEITSNDKNQLFLSNKSKLSESVIPGKGYSVFTFTLSDTPKNTDDTWKISMQRFNSASANFVIKIVTTDGKVIKSSPHPFYNKDAFSDSIYKLLEQ